MKNDLDSLLNNPACQPCFWLSSYGVGLHWAMAPQSSAKTQFYCSVYYNLWIEIMKLIEHIKMWKKLRRKGKKLKLIDVRFDFLKSLFKEKLMFKSQLIKSYHRFLSKYKIDAYGLNFFNDFKIFFVCYYNNIGTYNSYLMKSLLISLLRGFSCPILFILWWVWRI